MTRADCRLQSARQPDANWILPATSGRNFRPAAATVAATRRHQKARPKFRPVINPHRAHNGANEDSTVVSYYSLRRFTVFAINFPSCADPTESRGDFRRPIAKVVEDAFLDFGLLRRVFTTVFEISRWKNSFAKKLLRRIRLRRREYV